MCKFSCTCFSSIGRFQSCFWKHSQRISHSFFHSDKEWEISSPIALFPICLEKKKKKKKEEENLITLSSPQEVIQLVETTHNKTDVTSSNPPSLCGYVKKQ
jgi:DNA repair protein RadC